MAETIAERLQRMTLKLPEPPAPVAAYVGYRVHGGQVWISGQLPFRDGKVSVTGIVGREVGLDDAQAAARTCAINLLAQLQAACGGDLERVRACLRLSGYVASTPDFTAQPTVINAASELIATVLGEAGRHSRIAVGVASLPLNASVEVEGVFAID